MRRIVLRGATHCSICGEAPTPENPMTLGHIVALKDGGPTALGNLRPECQRCNYGRKRLGDFE